MAEYLPSMYKALGSISNMVHTQKVLNPKTLSRSRLES